MSELVLVGSSANLAPVIVGAVSGGATGNVRPAILPVGPDLPLAAESSDGHYLPESGKIVGETRNSHASEEGRETLSEHLDVQELSDDTGEWRR